MAGVFIDIPGVGNVEAKNAATEATLREILKALNGGGGGGGGGAGGGGGGGGGGSPAKSLGGAALGKAFNVLGKSVGMAVGGVGKLATGAISAAGAAVGLSEATIGAASKLANLEASASGAASIFEGIPLVGKAFTAVAKAADQVVASYTTIATTGASFGGSISSFAKSASDAGMTMDQFASLIKGNGEALGAFGVTTEDGAKRFGQVSKAMRTTSGDLYALGFTTAEINQGLASYGKLLKIQGQQGKQSNAELAAGAKNYLKEMDMLAKVTGQERAAKEKEREALMVDGMFRASMAGLNKDVEDSAASLIQSMPNKEMQDFAKDIIANGTATTEANRKLMSQQPALAAQLTALHKQTQSNVAISKDQMNQTLNTGKVEGMAAMQRSKTALAASEEWQGTAAAMGGWNKVNLDAIKTAGEQQEESKKNTDGFNEKMQAMQQRIAEVSNNFKSLLANSGILDVLMQAFNWVAKVANEYLVPAFNIVSSVITKLSEGMSLILSPVIDYLGEKFGAKGLGGTVEWIDGILNTVFDAVAGTVRGAILAFDGIWDGIQPVLGALGRLWDSLFGVSDTTSSFGDIMIDVGAFLGDAFRVLGHVVGFLIDYGVRPLAWTIKTFMIDPLIWVGKIIGNVIGFFIDFKDNIAIVSDYLGEFIDDLLRLLNKVTLGAAGISEEEKAKRDAVRAEARAARDAEKEKIKTAEQHKAELKEDKKKFGEQKLTHEKVTTQAKKEADLKEASNKAAEKAASIDMNQGAEGILKAFAKQEGSPLVPAAQAAKAGEAAKKEIEQKGQEKAAAEKKAADEAEAKKQAEEKAKGEGAKKPSQTQESAETLLAQLNTNMAQLLKISKEQKDIADRQLTVQKSLSGDLFASVG